MNKSPLKQRIQSVGHMAQLAFAQYLAIHKDLNSFSFRAKNFSNYSAQITEVKHQVEENLGFLNETIEEYVALESSNFVQALKLYLEKLLEILDSYLALLQIASDKARGSKVSLETKTLADRKHQRLLGEYEQLAQKLDGLVGEFARGEYE